MTPLFATHSLGAYDDDLSGVSDSIARANERALATVTSPVRAVRDRALSEIGKPVKWAAIGAGGALFFLFLLRQGGRR